MRQNHGKFLATVTADDIELAQLLLKQAGGGFKRQVTCFMTPLIVNRLEMIEVDQYQRRGGAGPAMRIDYLSELCVEAAAVSGGASSGGAWDRALEAYTRRRKDNGDAIAGVSTFGNGNGESNIGNSAGAGLPAMRSAIRRPAWAEYITPLPP